MRTPISRPERLRLGIKPLPQRMISFEKWVMRGNQLYGRDRTKWEFRCYMCGHIQSIAKTIAALKEAERCTGKKHPAPRDLAHMIFFSCEGRWNDTVGCDWTLGGLFSGSSTLVQKNQGPSLPVFEFAADPIRCDLGYLPYEERHRLYEPPLVLQGGTS